MSPQAAAYVRTSTRKQDLEGQRQAIQTWAKKEGHVGLHFFEDDHISGRRGDRAGIEAVLEAAGRGEFSLLAVSELSRIGRSMGAIAKTADQLCDAGVRIVLVATGTVIDYSTLEGRALLNALALAADIEWHLIQERNARGRETIRRRKVKVGRKRQEVSLDAIWALREQGYGVRRVAGELGVGKSTIARRLEETACTSCNKHRRAVGALCEHCSVEDR